MNDMNDMNDMDDQKIVRALRNAGNDGPPLEGTTAAALARGRAAVRRRRLVGASVLGASSVAVAVAAVVAVPALQAWTQTPPVAIGHPTRPTCVEEPANLTASPEEPATLELLRSLEAERDTRNASLLKSLGPGWKIRGAALEWLSGPVPASALADIMPPGWTAYAFSTLPSQIRENGRPCMVDVTTLHTEEVTTSDGDVLVIEYTVREIAGVVRPDGMPTPPPDNVPDIRQVAYRLEVSKRLDTPAAVAALEARASITAETAPDSLLYARAVSEDVKEDIIGWLAGYQDELIAAVDEFP